MDVRPFILSRTIRVPLESDFGDGRADPKIGTPEGDRLNVLSVLVERYEAQHLLLDLPDTIEAIRFLMEQAGLTGSDMQPYLGNLNRV
jgi:HTH-type transcriptional regulator / antitoxin HigA